MAQSFFDIESRRVFLEDLTRRHEHFPYESFQHIQYMEERDSFDERHYKRFHEESVRQINEKPMHLKEFSGRFMDVFNCLYVGNGFRHMGNYINFLHKGQDMVHECNSFVLSQEREAAFLDAVESVKYIGKRAIPEIAKDAENGFFTNGWSQEQDAYLFYFKDGRRPMVGYLNRASHGTAYEEGILLIRNKDGERVIDHQNELKDNRVMAADLNLLEDGLGERVLELLHRHSDYATFKGIEKQITTLLSDKGYSPSEIFIDSENRRKYSLQTIFSNIAGGYQFADQFDM